MATSHTFREVLLYSLMSCFAGLWIFFFVFYECIRCYGPRQPDALTGHIYPERLQQPWDVYLTKLQVDWLDYGPVVPMVFFAAGFYLNSRWKIIRNTPYLPKRKKFFDQ